MADENSVSVGRSGGAPDERARLHRIPYDMALRTLDDQKAEYDGVKTRGTQFMAFVGSGSAFLAGSAISATGSRNDLFFTLAMLATVMTAMSVLTLALLLRPATFQFRLRPDVILEKWIARSVPRPSEADLLAGLAERMHEMAVANEGGLVRLRAQFRLMVILGGLALVLWTCLVWVAA